jgi:hypothetical protein
LRKRTRKKKTAGANLIIDEDAIINMLKTLPEETLLDIFWKTLAGYDISPLTDEEREGIRKGREELEKGETIKWADLK